MNSESFPSIPERDRSGLYVFGALFSQEIYNARPLTNHSLKQITFRFEKDFIMLLLSIFQFYLRKRIHEYDIGYTLENLMTAVQDSVYAGMDDFCDRTWNELTHTVSPSFQPIIEQALLQVSSHVRAIVGEKVGVMLAKWWDAAIGYMEKQYVHRIEHLELSNEELEKQLDAKEKSRGSLNTLLRDAILRFRKNFQSLQTELSELRSTLAKTSSEKSDLQVSLKERIALLEEVEREMEKYKKWWMKSIPYETAYRSIDTLIAPLNIPWKTLAEKVGTVLSWRQTSDIYARKNLELQGQIDVLTALNSQLEWALSVERQKVKEVTHEREEYIVNQLESTLAWYFWALLEEFRNGEYLDTCRAHFENMFFQHRAWHATTTDFCINTLQRLKMEWKNSPQRMQQFLRPNANIPEGFMRMNIERTALEFAEIIHSIGMPQQIQEKIRSYERMARFEQWDVIDV